MLPTILELSLLLAVAWGLAAIRAPGPAWIAAISVYLLSWGLLRDGNALVLASAWLLFLPVAALLGIPALRRTVLSRHLRAAFARAIPEMSHTEREALEAGSVWWEAELFSGSPNWNRLLGLPAPVRAADERAFIEGPVEDLCRMLDDWKITHELLDLPPPVWQFLKQQGFFGMIIPRVYGGL